MKAGVHVQRPGVLVVTLLFLGIILASAFTSALTFVTPTDGQTIKGTVNFNVTSLNAINNCTWRTSGDGVLGIGYNTSAGITNINISNNTAILTQTASTTLNVTCFNQTNSGESSTITIGIDNSAPVCAFSTDTPETKYMSQLGIETRQSSTDLTTLTYAWTLYDPSGGTQTTKTSASPTFSGTDFDETGPFKLALVVTDAASTSTTCTNASIFVRGTNDEVVKTTTTTAVHQNKQQSAKTTMFVIGAILIFLVIAVAAFLVIGLIKKSR